MGKSKKLFQALVAWLSLTNDDGKLSISNIAVAVLIAKIGFSTTMDYPTVAGLMLALLNYSHKRHSLNKICLPDDKLSPINAQIADLEAKFASVLLGRK
jgi:hypothetical protein